MKHRKLPKGFGLDPSTDQLRCPHRDVSCCKACADRYREIVAVRGQHFWTSTPEEKRKLLIMLSGVDSEMDSEYSAPYVAYPASAFAPRPQLSPRHSPFKKSR